MNKRLHPFVAFLALTLVMLACASPSGNDSDVPSSEDQLATIVASTMQALTPITTESTPEPTATAGLLPHSFYYLGTDNAGLTQVFRVERDGSTIHQATFEPTDVDSYGVSSVDGRVAYVSNNQMLLINADGSGRRVLVDGGAVDENNPFLSRIDHPVFSPNGETIAYGHQGLSFYAIGTSITNRVIKNDIKEIGDGLFIPQEMYYPEKYSPDGTKLLITLGYYEGASSAIYYPASNSLVRLNGDYNGLICCGDQEWSADGSVFYTAYPFSGMFSSGMWRVDAVTGAVSTLLPGDADDGTFNVPDAPFLAPDGQLYYFFTKLPISNGFVNSPPLQLVRSAPDGVTGREILRPDTFESMNEVLWAPDASFVIVALAPTPDTYYGGRAEVIYLDGRPSIVLTPFAQEMKWGP